MYVECLPEAAASSPLHITRSIRFPAASVERIICILIIIIEYMHPNTLRRKWVSREVHLWSSGDQKIIFNLWEIRDLADKQMSLQFVWLAT